MDVLLADPLLLDRRAEALLEVLDALLHDVLGGARAGGDQDGLGALEPRRARISETPSIRWAWGPSESAISASRLLLELFWLPRTSTMSALGASSRTASWRFWVA